MQINEFGEVFSCDAERVSSVFGENTPLSKTSLEILEMIHCYALDGKVFLEKGDLVNAAASFAYGYGWLDAGVFLGYLTGRDILTIPILADEISENLLDHLSEKTNRYQRMLNQAIKSVSVLPDRETVLFHAAADIFEQADKHLNFGTNLLNCLDELNALVHFSYGYGWLDAGVRSGLFGVFENRDLFTI